MKTIVFFNNKGGVGKTTLVYHLAWMFERLGLRVVAADLDPQANLTSVFLPEEAAERIFPEGEAPQTILGAIQPLVDRLGDLEEPHVEEITERLALIPGDPGLSSFEDRLAEAWTACLSDNPSSAHDAFRVMSAFYRAALLASQKRQADLAFLDVAPGLGVINRAALVAADYVVTPMGTDLYSLRGLHNLGPALRQWRQGWSKRLKEQIPKIALPSGDMEPLGYVLMQHVVRDGQPARPYLHFAKQIPYVYHRTVLGESEQLPVPTPDPYLLATLKHYHSLMPLAQAARKPIFDLKPADGAVGGSYARAVSDCFNDFARLARRIADLCRLSTPLMLAR